MRIFVKTEENTIRNGVKMFFPHEKWHKITFKQTTKNKKKYNIPILFLFQVMRCMQNELGKNGNYTEEEILAKTKAVMKVRRKKRFL